METIDHKQNKTDAVKSRTDSMEKEKFKCPQAGSNLQPKIRHVGKLTECLEKKAGSCPFSLSFGLGFFCKHKWDNSP
ncbi:MAG: hypothetical protein ACYSWP_14125 [Planctomycetota bacterium]